MTTEKLTEQQKTDVKFQDHLANVIGCDGRTAQVCSVFQKELFERGGSMYGRRREWGINHYSFTKEPHITMKALNLTLEEYNEVEQKFTDVYDHEKKDWFNRPRTSK